MANSLHNSILQRREKRSMWMTKLLDFRQVIRRIGKDASRQFYSPRLAVGAVVRVVVLEGLPVWKQVGRIVVDLLTVVSADNPAWNVLHQFPLFLAVAPQMTKKPKVNKHSH